MKEAAKWQFYRKTHFPFSTPSAIAAFAYSPWPWPRDFIINFEPIDNLVAKFYTSIPGSAPVLRTKINGVILLESSNAPYRLNGGNST